MTIKEININYGQWLSDVLSEIPTDTIFNKTITGCGATSLEINSNRNSIIIEPNVPVILGKKEQHPFLLAVYEGISTEDVKAYLAGEVDGYRKIITTPEGFDKKVQPAMYAMKVPIYDDYFLLFDECEKTIQDIGYRGDIYLPVEDFFKFKNKAMVSATPLVPSDPRFEENGFTMLKLVPTYNYQPELNLCITNNTVAVLRKLLAKLQNEKVCIFLNSTDTTLSLIQTLKLEGRCKVFCGEKSVKKLKRENFPDVSDMLGELSAVNFFTSRFYAAVDIKLEYQPHVIVLSDVVRAAYSMIDPQTEVVQAIGRFRNGVRKAYHIANTYDRLQCQTREALFHKLEGEEKIYQRIQAVEVKGEVEEQARFQALNGMEIKRFFTREGKRNHFMWDNAWEDEKIKSYYRYPASLTEAYKNAPFVLNTFCMNFPITDEDRLRRESKGLNTTELWSEVMKQLAAIKTEKSDAEATYLLEELGGEFATMVQAFVILGAERVAALGYNRRKIETALGCVEENQLLTSEKMQKTVYGRYKTGDVVETSEINGFMKHLIDEEGIPFDGRVDKKIVQLFFQIKDCKVRGNRGFILGNRMFEF